MQVKRKEHASMQQETTDKTSYNLTTYAWLNTILKRVDTITNGKAGVLQRLFSFLLVGGVCALINLVIFTLLYYKLSHPGTSLRSIFTHPSLLFAHDTANITNSSAIYAVAFIISAEISILANFLINDRTTFRHIRGVYQVWQTRCMRFHITAIGGTVVTLLISFTLLHVVGLSALISQAIAIIIATAFNFIFHHLFTYRQHETIASKSRQEYTLEHSNAI
jgi:putative flippase GtrA